MRADLLAELSLIFCMEAEAIVQPYAWPPRPPLTDEERREVDRLRVTASSIRYRANVALLEEGRSEW